MASKKVRLKEKAGTARKKAATAKPASGAKKKRAAAPTVRVSGRFVILKSTGRAVLASDYGKKSFPIDREPGASTRPGDKKKSKTKKQARTS
jgi:hypothetical protein